MHSRVGAPRAGKTGHTGDHRLLCGFFQNSEPPKSPKSSSSTCEPYREQVELGLRLGRNAMAIWQDLVSDHGFAGGYEAVKRFVRKLRGPQRPEPAGVILTAPGEEAQVDYGSGPMVRDPQSGKYRRTRLFILTLAIAASRYAC